MPVRIIIFILVLFLSACTPSPFTHNTNVNQVRLLSNIQKQPIGNDFIPKNIKIVAIGDSLTQGVGDSTKRGGYLPYLEEQLESEKGILDVHINNFGVKGNQSSQILKRVRTEELEKAIHEANMIVLTVGGNDVMKVVRNHFSHLKMEYFEKEQRSYEKNVELLLTHIRQHNKTSPIIFVGLYNPFFQWFSEAEEMKGVLNRWNETSRSIVANTPNMYFIDIDDIFENTTENLLYTDYFHPNDLGYKLIANRMYESIHEDVVYMLTNHRYIVRKEES